MAEELVDVIDERDRVVRRTTRLEMRRDNLLHRVVSIVVLGGDGRLLVHRRAETKDVWPGRWDVAAGGVVAAGEGYDEAARRELQEELGVEAPLQALGAYDYDNDRTRYLARGYYVRHDGPFSFTDDEVVDVRWVTNDELTVLRANAGFCPDSYLPLSLLPGRLWSPSARSLW